MPTVGTLFSGIGTADLAFERDRMLGNAMTVNTVEWIARRIMEVL